MSSMRKLLIVATLAVLGCTGDGTKEPAEGTWQLTETRSMLCTSSTLDPGIPSRIELVYADNPAGFDGYAFVYFTDGTHAVADWDWMPIEPGPADAPEVAASWVRLLNGSYLRGGTWWVDGTGAFAIDASGAVGTDGFWQVRLRGDDAPGSCSYGFDAALEP